MPLIKESSSRLISAIFHPLFMPSVGMLILLNSGTYLELLNPGAKRAILMVTSLGTLVFPLMMYMVLYYRKIYSRGGDEEGREGRMILYLVIMILYFISYIYFQRLPLSRIIHAFFLSSAMVVLGLFALSFRFRLCPNAAALGGLSALVISLGVLYQTSMEVVLSLVLLAAGISASARIAGGMQKAYEVYTGFAMGFIVAGLTLLLYPL